MAPGLPGDLALSGKLALTAAATAGATAAAFFRYMRAVRIPKLVASGDAKELHRLLLDDEVGAILREPYWPHVLHWHWIASSGLAAVRAMPMPHGWRRSHEQTLTLRDGGTVSLDWWGDVPSSQPGGPPVALLLPGIGNSSLSYYIRRCMDRLARAGFRPVALNYRGVEHLDITSPRLASADTWQDLPEVLEEIRRVCPDCRVVAVGFSMGGTILSKYLGESGSTSGIEAAVVVSPPLAYPAHMQELKERPLLSFAITLPLKIWMWQKRRQVARVMPQVQLHKILASRTLLELGEHLLLHNGYATLEEYFGKNDPEPVLRNIAAPLLVIAAKDDPLVLPVPRESIKANPRILLVETEGGGHLGFASSSFGSTIFGSSWADSAAAKFLRFHVRSNERPVVVDDGAAAPVRRAVPSLAKL